jgi:hypothetical protein
VALYLAMCSASASASGPWDGSWFRDTQHSQVPDVIQLSKASDGTWTFFNGFAEEKLVVDGKVHRIGSSATELRVLQPDPQTLLITEGIHGREYETESLSMSADRKTLTSKVQRLGWDGEERQSSQIYVRTGPGYSLQGIWKPALASDSRVSPGPQQPIVKSPPQPSWVIWTGPDGTMTWFIPRSGEVLRGKADMQARPIQGPYHEGETFTWRQASPERIEFTAAIDGNPVEYAVETLSADHQSWTDTLWAPGHEDTKIISLFRRQP